MDGMVLEVGGVSEAGVTVALADALRELGLGGGMEDGSRHGNLPVLRLQGQGVVVEAQKLGALKEISSE